MIHLPGKPFASVGECLPMLIEPRGICGRGSDQLCHGQHDRRVAVVFCALIFSLLGFSDLGGVDYAFPIWPAMSEVFIVEVTQQRFSDGTSLLVTTKRDQFTQGRSGVA